MELDELKERLRTLKSAFLIYSTYRHYEKTEASLIARSHFRVCIPFKENLAANMFMTGVSYKELCAELADQLGLRIDESTIIAENLCYKPGKPHADALYEYYINELSEGFDWEHFMFPEKRRKSTQAPEYRDPKTGMTLPLDEKFKSSVAAKASDVNPEAKIDFSELTCFADVEAEDVSWLWFPYIALGKVTIITGEEGIGKSWLTCKIGSIVSNGSSFPMSDEKFEPGNVLMFSAEDGLADTIKPRLISCKANTNKIFAPPNHIVFDEDGFKKFEEYVAKLKPKLITIDPLFAYTSTKTDINSANQSRAVSSRLAKIAEQYNCAIVLVRHIGKSKGMGDPRAAGMGSTDWRAAVRSELLVGKDPNNENERVIIHIKSNLASRGNSIGFTIENTQYGAAFRWTGKSNLTADTVLSLPIQKKSSRPSEAESFLLDILADGEKPASEIIEKGESIGLTRQNLRTACKKLGVKSRKEGNLYNETQRWIWYLHNDEIF